MEDTDIPKALVKRVVKAKVAAIASADGGEGKKEVQLNKDALLAFSESAKIFITYLTATANDICRESKRQIISADDITAALSDLDFQQLVDPLNQALEAFKVENKEKNKKKAEQVKKRKASKVAGPADGTPVQGAVTEPQHQFAAATTGLASVDQPPLQLGPAGVLQQS